MAALLGHPRAFAGLHAVVGGKYPRPNFIPKIYPARRLFHHARHDFLRLDMLVSCTTTSAAGLAAHQHGPGGKLW